MTDELYNDVIKWFEKNKDIFKSFILEKNINEEETELTTTITTIQPLIKDSGR